MTPKDEFDAWRAEAIQSPEVAAWADRVAAARPADGGWALASDVGRAADVGGVWAKPLTRESCTEWLESVLAVQQLVEAGRVEERCVLARPGQPDRVFADRHALFAATEPDGPLPLPDDADIRHEIRLRTAP